MTTKPRFKVGDSVIVGSRKSEWYGKIGQIITIYDSGRYGVTCHGEPTRAFKTTSLCHADKWYKAAYEARREEGRNPCEVNSRCNTAMNNEMAKMHDRGFFPSTNTRTVKEREGRRHQEPVIVETVDDDSDEETDGELSRIIDDADNYGKSYGAKEHRTPNDHATTHTTTMTDDDVSIIGDMGNKTTMDVESTLSMEIHRALDKQAKLMMDRVQKLAEENAILRIQSSKKDRIIAILMEDFKVMDINDAYSSDDRIK
jgi:hypothetical protein